jgi:transglutaminase-like putative cysteine protease
LTSLASDDADDAHPRRTVRPTFLVASRYCDTDLMADMAWSLFKDTTPGWSHVQAICGYVHQRLTFGYDYARATRMASEGHNERRGACCDFAHLAITLCRCMNIPAHYCAGYLGDI